MTKEAEAALVRRCREGDKGAFGELVRHFAGRAMGTARLLLRNGEDAQDASQEAFVKAWRNIGRFDGRSRFFTWLSVILRNVCRDRLRRRRGDEMVELTDGHAHPNPDSDPVALAQRSERAEQIRQAIRELPAPHRDVIVMSHFLDFSYRQMAQSLDVPIGTVTSRLHAARKALRDKLEGMRP